mgnify:CR=1 FL=1
MSKRNSGEQKRENSQLKITFSVLIMVLSFLAELYTMIILKGNPIYLAGFGLVFLIFSYVLMNSVMQLQYQKLREEKEEHEGLLKSEKASYLIIKKSFDEVFQRMDYIEKNLQLPTEELLTAQKAFAKININRSKENADALMNSNDRVVDNLLQLKESMDAGFEQFAGKQQGIVQNGFMLFKIALAHPAVFAQRHGLIRDGQVGKKIVAAAMIGQFHTNLLSNTKKQLWT